MVINNSGIYKIQNICNGKFYIGSTKNLQHRKTNHFAELRRNNHGNKILQNSFNKYKEESFVFEVLEFCEPEERFELEQIYLDVYQPTLNVSKFSTGGERIQPKARKLTDENIKDIFLLYANGESQKSIAEKFGIKGCSSIPLILNRHTYWNVEIDKDVLERANSRRSIFHVHDRKFKLEDVVEVISMYCEGSTHQQIADKYKVSEAIIFDIIKRRSYKDVILSSELEDKLKEVKKQRENKPRKS